MEGVPIFGNVHFCTSASSYTGVRFSLLMHMCSKYLCQSVVKVLGPDVSTGLFIAPTLEERGEERGRSGDGQEERREEEENERSLQ